MERGFLSSPEELIDEARNGRMFILVDDEDRENEGDLVIPAQMATPDAINFMARYGRGPVGLGLACSRPRGPGGGSASSPRVGRPERPAPATRPPSPSRSRPRKASPPASPRPI